METSDLPDRLQEALEFSGMSKKRLIGKLKNAGAKGASHPSVQKFLKGVTTPSLPFLEEYAGLCGVRLAWLVCGQGAPTEQGEIRRIQDTQRGIRIRKELQAAFAKGFPQYLELAPVSRAACAEALWAFGDFRKSVRALRVPPRRDPVEGRSKRLRRRRMAQARVVGRALWAPVDLLRRQDASPDQLTEYVVLMSFALLSLMPPEARRRSFLGQARHEETDTSGELPREISRKPLSEEEEE